MKQIIITKIIFPPVASEMLELDLVKLTEYLVKNKKAERTGGLLGGEFGYGCDFENDTFMLHPYCWCEEDNCGWCNGKKPNFLHKKSNLKIKWYKWIGRDMKFNKKISPKKWDEIYQECIKSIINL